MATAMRNSVTEDTVVGESDPTQAAWSMAEQLLAAVVDEIRNVAWMYASAHSKSSVQQPKPIERPGVKRSRRSKTPISVAMQMDPRLAGLTEFEAAQKLRELTGRA